MSLTRSDMNHSIEQPLTSDVYLRYKNEVHPAVQDTITRYIDQKISKVNKFSIATLFPHKWPEELDPIYHLCRDEKLAAFVLAFIVMNHLIGDERRWLYTKTNIQERDFESNFYWR
jgi:hypothetical protein